MYVLITYDIDTTTPQGKRALSRIGKLYKNYGIRVQYSVWECLLDPAELESLKSETKKCLENVKGNIRIYQLPKNWDTKIQQIKGDKPKRVTEPIIV